MRLPHPYSGDSRSKEMSLASSTDKQTRIYDTECSKHHLSLSTLRSQMVSYLHKFTSKCQTQTTPSLEWSYSGPRNIFSTFW